MPKIKLLFAGLSLMIGLFFALLCVLTIHTNGLRALGMMELYFMTFAVVGNFAVAFFYFYNKMYVMPFFVLTTALSFAGSLVHQHMYIDSIELVCFVQMLAVGVSLIINTRPITKSLTT